MREITRPAFLFLLLAGVFSARLTEGLASPDLLGSLVSRHRSLILQHHVGGFRSNAEKALQ